MFRVKVVGTYIARSSIMDKEKVKKNYEVEGNLPDSAIKAPLSAVKNKLLAPALAAKYKDYVTFLTYHIVELTPLDAKAKEVMGRDQISYMDRPALLATIKELNLPVKAEYYPNLFKLREAVATAKEDPKGYKKFFDLHEPDLRLDLEMAKCNPELFNSVEPGFVGSVSLPDSGPTKPKAAKSERHIKHTEDRISGLAADMQRDGEFEPEAASAATGVEDL